MVKKTKCCKCGVENDFLVERGRGDVICRHCCGLFDDNGVYVPLPAEKLGTCYDIHREAGFPTLYVQPYEKYATVVVDTISAQTPERMVFKDDAAEELDALCHKYHKKATEDQKHKRWPVTFAADNIGFSFASLRIPLAKDLAERCAYVVYDEDNLTKRGSVNL